MFTGKDLLFWCPKVQSRPSSPRAPIGVFPWIQFFLSIGLILNPKCRFNDNGSCFLLLTLPQYKKIWKHLKYNFRIDLAQVYIYIYLNWHTVCCLTGLLNCSAQVQDCCSFTFLKNLWAIFLCASLCVISIASVIFVPGLMFVWPVVPKIPTLSHPCSTDSPMISTAMMIMTMAMDI